MIKLEKIKGKWTQWKARFETFAVRERLLMVGAVVAVLYLLWEFGLRKPLSDELKILEARDRVATQVIQTKEAERAVLTNLATRDPDANLKRELAILKEQLLQSDRDMNELSLGLIAAHRLPLMLHDVLKQSRGIQLQSITSLPVQELTIETEDEEKSSTGEPVTLEPIEPSAQGDDRENSEKSTDGSNESILDLRLYRHGVAISFHGSFMEITAFLARLEGAPWQFYWDSLEYEVNGYPNAKALLRVFTLSTERGVLDDETAH